MKYYLEVILLPNGEIDLYFLWKKVYQQIHLGLVANKVDENLSAIGVAFPHYNADKYCLGKTLRLFADNKEILEKFNCKKWLDRLAGYVHYTDIRTVPEKINSYAIYSRFHSKGQNIQRLARRYAKRNSLTLEQAFQRYSYYVAKRSSLPFIRLKSLSTSKKNDEYNSFKLFIEKNLVEQLIRKGFSTYGLSPLSSVPEF